MKRKTLKDKLKTVDIVLTTYNTVVKDFQNKRKRKGDSGLHEIDFFRVVLDEGMSHVVLPIAIDKFLYSPYYPSKRHAVQQGSLRI